MEGKEFTVEIFEKALEIYRELPPGEESLIIEALAMVNKHSHICGIRAKKLRGREQEDVKEYFPPRGVSKSENNNR